jgi:hypothetical protein
MRRSPSSTSCSEAPLAKSAMTRSIDVPQPAIAIPVCPVGTNSAAVPAAFAARVNSSAAVILPTAQSLPTVRTMRLVTSYAAPEKRGAAGGMRRSQIRESCASASARISGSSLRNACSPLTISSRACNATTISARYAGGSAPPGGAIPIKSAVGSKRKLSRTVATIGASELRYGSTSRTRFPACCGSTTTTTASREYAITPCAVLASRPPNAPGAKTT